MTAHPMEALSQQNVSKKITILGATGTIGQNTLDIVRQSPPNKYNIQTLTARTRVDDLIAIAKEFSPEHVVIEDDSLYEQLKDGLAGTDTEIHSGSKAIKEVAAIETDVVVSGIVGAAALAPTLAAIEKGATVALANKECLVCAGELLMQSAAKHNAQIIPVDSEHNSLFQTFDFDRPESVTSITLTASGGPFLHHSIEEMSRITPKEAVKHPNWSMGAKISVDSATMMNKGLEIIEAYHLFPVKKEQINVLVHPESIIHSLVQYNDGSNLACMSLPDMKIPLAFALGWPDRQNSYTTPLDLATLGKLTFFSPDENKFPALRLAKDALKTGGSAPIILNAANEWAVDNFLSGKIGFLDIVKLVENTIESIPDSSPHSIEEILHIDKLARRTCQDLANNF